MFLYNKSIGRKESTSSKNRYPHRRKYGRTGVYGRGN